MIRRVGAENAEKVFEYVWYGMIDALHNSGDIPPDDHDSPEKWEAIAWWENKMKKVYSAVIENAIFDAFN